MDHWELREKSRCGRPQDPKEPIESLVALEPGFVFVPEFGYFRRDDHPAVTLVGVLLVILLVVFLGSVKLLEGRNLSDNGFSPNILFFQLVNHLFGDVPLLIIMIKDH